MAVKKYWVTKSCQNRCTTLLSIAACWCTTNKMCNYHTTDPVTKPHNTPPPTLCLPSCPSQWRMKPWVWEAVGWHFLPVAADAAVGCILSFLVPQNGLPHTKVIHHLSDAEQWSDYYHPAGTSFEERPRPLHLHDCEYGVQNPSILCLIGTLRQ